MELLAGILGAAGLLVFFRALAGLLLFPIAGDGASLYWRVEGACPHLEYRLRGYLWLLHGGLCCAELVVVDCGLTCEARRGLECLLQRETAARVIDEYEWKKTVCDHGTRA